MENLKDDRGYNQVWADRFSTRVRALRRCHYLISQMNFDSSKSLMEIGCGLGTSAYLIAKETGVRVLATDLCGPFIDEARKKNDLPNLRYEVLDFHKADQLKGQRFDYIVGNGILHHLYFQLDEALAKMRDLLNHNGKLLFFEPNIANPYVHFIFRYAALRKWARLEPDEMAFSKTFISKKLSQAGFQSVRVAYKDFLLPGIPNFLIAPSIVVGAMLEKVPLVKRLSQSLFICAMK